MGLSPKSNYEKKKSFLGLTSGKFLEALGSGIGTGSIFCLSFSLSNRECKYDKRFLGGRNQLEMGLMYLFKDHCSGP